MCYLWHIKQYFLSIDDSTLESPGSGLQIQALIGCKFNNLQFHCIKQEINPQHYAVKVITTLDRNAANSILQQIATNTPVINLLKIS